MATSSPRTARSSGGPSRHCWCEAAVEAWQDFIDHVAHKANANRGKRVAEELDAMRELDAAKLPEYVEERGV